MHSRVWSDNSPFVLDFDLPGVGPARAQYFLYPDIIGSLDPVESLAECLLVAGDRPLACADMTMEQGVQWRQVVDGTPGSALDMVAARLTEFVNFVHSHCPPEITAVARIPRDHSEPVLHPR